MTDPFKVFHSGTVIPAMPLALDSSRRFDPRRQRALIRYFHAAGAGGLAVGVHTTQFEIRLPKFNLYRPVLELASQEMDRLARSTGRPLFKIAGVCGRTPQALAEATLARSLGYDAGLLSLAALDGASDRELLEHCRKVSRGLPLIGFYLQRAVGGPPLSYGFWRGFFKISAVIGVKMAPFNRYHTLDVVRALAESGRAGEITLYTGNDDNIVPDLLTTYRLKAGKKTVSLRVRGGLLGHWAVWTRQAVALLSVCQAAADSGKGIPGLLTRGIAVTDCNAAFFDAANGFKGCIAGLHYVLKRQGLLSNLHCLLPKERLSPGQAAEIERVYQAYPDLHDDAFVRRNLSVWMKA